ncbi:MAG: NAD+ synthase [Candidatus Omnitrophota bacterium]
MQKKIIAWIKEQVKTAKAKGVVVGLSGGIDSAVTAALCCRALGKNKLVGLILPCLSQNQDLVDARLVAKRLGIKVKTIDLNPIYKICLMLLPKGKKIACANLKARLRMLILYYFANNMNYLVCGTGNKTELLIGYFTKFGDGATDILPLGGLLKSQVRELAGDLNIPQRIINKAPTAGLWPGQTDEAEIGITYKELDQILLGIESGRPRKLPFKKIAKIRRKISEAKHKRQPPAIFYA